MSNDRDKFLNSKRRHKNNVAIARQVRIAKQHGFGLRDQELQEPHRLVKHHVMDCGNPQCTICGNPRKKHKNTLTQQEKRIFQDIDTPNDKGSNGLKPDE